VRRMRWGANRRGTLHAKRGQTTVPATAISKLRQQDATSSVAIATASPQGEANVATENITAAETQSLPLEGKVPNGCEADEVGRKSLRYPKCGEAAKYHARHRHNRIIKAASRHALRCHSLTASTRCHLISRLAPTASPQGEASGAAHTAHLYIENGPGGSASPGPVL